MARWFRGRRKAKSSEENAGENPPQQVPRTGEGALQPIYPDLQPEAKAAASEEMAPTQGEGGERPTGEAQEERPQRRRGGRGSGSRRGNRARTKGDEAAQEAPTEEAGQEVPESTGGREGVPRDEAVDSAEPAEHPEQQTTAQPETSKNAGQQQMQRRDRGRRGRRGRRGGRQDRGGPAKPLAPAHPEEGHQQPVSEVSPDLPAAAAMSQQNQRQQPRQQPKKPRGVVVLTIGLPGSGKSSWFKRRGVAPLSSDMLRTLLFDDITEQRYQDLVFSTLRALLRARLIAGMPWNYIDATNLSPKERHGWIKMAREYGYEVHAVFFNVPLEVCQERNKKRSRMVPDEVMQRMANKLRPPNFDEGFSKIIVVRVRKADQEPQTQAEEPPADAGEGSE